MLLKGLAYISTLVNSITQASVKVRCWEPMGTLAHFRRVGYFRPSGLVLWSDCPSSVGALYCVLLEHIFSFSYTYTDMHAHIYVFMYIRGTVK